jgi:hypothetical protein
MTTKRVVLDLSSLGAKAAPKEKKKKKDGEKLVKPNNTKRELMKRIQQYQQQKQDEHKYGDYQAGGMGSKHEKSQFADDFRNTLKYLSEVANQEQTPGITKIPARTRRTYKRRASPGPSRPVHADASDPIVSLELPDSLGESFRNTGTFQPKHGALANNNVTKPRISTQQYRTPIHNDVPYGVLKNGTKPTYRMWVNKTQKNRAGLAQASVRSGVTSEEREKYEKKIQDLRDKFNLYLKPRIQTQEQAKQQVPRKKRISKLKRITTRKHRVGKNNKTRKVGILLKNGALCSQVQTERSLLRAKPLHVIKNHLYKHGLLKVGSNAPKHLLIELYEQSILAGDIKNTSQDVLLHNFLHQKEDM